MEKAWFFEGRLASAIDAFFSKNRNAVKEETSVYRIDEGFGVDGAKYWKSYVRPERFVRTRKAGLLYRSEITNGIITNIDQALSKGTGVMVKGPCGVGKSHSLINVVRKLESTGNYLVTFIPNCEVWWHTGNLYDAIISSFGWKEANYYASRAVGGTKEEVIHDFEMFVNAVDAILEKQGKKWVFIFDQVNWVFDKMGGRSDISDFKFPFDQIHRLIRQGRITSVISMTVSLCNQTNYSDDQRGFIECTYDHPLSMNRSELRLAFPALEESLDIDLDRMVAKLTGGVPLQVDSLLQSQSEETYVYRQLGRINESLGRLKEQSDTDHWKNIVKGAISCLMQAEVADTICFDRLHSVFKLTTSGARLYQAAFPLVLNAYETFFQNDLLEYARHHEGHLLEVCRDLEIKNDVRDRIFKQIVIQRCAHGVVALENSDGKLPQTCPIMELEYGDTLPYMWDDGMYVPTNWNFCGIDLVWRHGKNMWGVQVHVNQHQDVLNKFTNMCIKGDWHKTMENLYLVYLSPEKEVADLVDNDMPAEGSVWTPTIRVLWRDDVACLKGLEWPESCSL